jgi:hypothetical protein
VPAISMQLGSRSPDPIVHNLSRFPEGLGLTTHKGRFRLDRYAVLDP